MQSFFGFGPFTKNQVSEPARALASMLGEIDHLHGTNIIYWGTGDQGRFQNLGFRTTDQWLKFSFSAPVHSGRESVLLPALRYFMEGTHPKTGNPFEHEGKDRGVFFILLDGTIKDFEAVDIYCRQLVNDIIEGKRHLVRIIFVGLGEDFLEASRGQIQALVSQFGYMELPIFSSIMVDNFESIPEEAKSILMNMIDIASSGRILDADLREVCSFPSGMPGAFEFYLPSNTRNFYVDINGKLYQQAILEK